MKDLAKLLLGFILCLPCMAQEATEFPFVGEVTAEKLFVRSMPEASQASTVVTVLSYLDQVEVTGEKAGFYEIKAPKKSGVWIYGKNLKVEGNSATVIKDATIRIDSRITAQQIGTIKEGENLTVLKDHAGWYMVEAPEFVRFWAAKKYIRSTKKLDGTPPAEVTTSTMQKPATIDAAAQDKIKEAEALLDEQSELISKKELESVNFNPAADAYEQAAQLTSNPAVKRYAQDNANLCRKMQNIFVGLKANITLLELQADKLKEINQAVEQLRAQAEKYKEYPFRGSVDTTGVLLIQRPGTHKLVKDGQIICFLKTEDEAMIKKLYDLHNQHAGVKGEIVESPPAWQGYTVVKVEDVIAIPEDLSLGLD